MQFLESFEFNFAICFSLCALSNEIYVVTRVYRLFNLQKDVDKGYSDKYKIELFSGRNNSSL